MADVILLPILIPITAGLVILALPAKMRWVRETITIIATSLILFISLTFFKSEIVYIASWAFSGIEFALRLYRFSCLIITAAALFGFLTAIYSAAFLADKPYAKLFYAFLLFMIGFVSGAVLSDHLVTLLFFWEASLLALVGMIYVGKKDAFMTAIKAFIILGVSDLIMMVGIAIFWKLSGTLNISGARLQASGLGAASFVFLITGALAKSGAMPFHSWIPDASLHAPLPFMALVPAAFEKLLGIYFLTRVTMDMFRLEPGSCMSYALMTVGAITIILAVMMALIQKDYKRLLSYHAISQVGYMILGIGTLVPAGIVGGLFHMINNAMYKSCLFMTGGAVERQAGTTDLEKLGGLGARMPVTFACFIITALSISGVPPFNGFFSKEMIYEGALEKGWIFYASAAAGSFFTAVSFLKLGHAVFLGRSEARTNVREAPIAMLIPMIAISIGCVLFGIFHNIPIEAFSSAVACAMATFTSNMVLAAVTVIVLAGAFLNHVYGVKKTGSGFKAADHIHYAPVLSKVYEKAEKGLFDPYNAGTSIALYAGRLAGGIDAAIDWFYNSFIVSVTDVLTGAIRATHDGNFKTYIAVSLVASFVILAFLLL